MNPCCGGSLQKATKIIAILQLVFGIPIVVLGVLFLGGEAMLSSASPSDYDYDDDDDESRLAAAVGSVVDCVFIIVVGVLLILLSVLLLTGSNKRNHTRCLIWFVLNVIFLVSMFLETLDDISLTGVNGYADNFEFAFSIIWTIINCYFLWVVWAFMAEIEEAVKVAFYGGPKPQTV